MRFLLLVLVLQVLISTDSVYNACEPASLSRSGEGLLLESRKQKMRRARKRAADASLSRGGEGSRAGEEHAQRARESSSGNAEKSERELL